MWLSASEKLTGALGRTRGGTTLQDRVARLFEETREDLYRYLLTLGLHPPQAQEATQEVFLRLYAALRQGEDIRHPRAWIFRVAHNLGLKTRVRQDAEAPFDLNLEERCRARDDDPESRLLRRERTLRFHRAVEALSDQQRRCLFLRLEGLRYREIGNVLGISASAVGEFLRRAMVRLGRAGDE